MLNIIGISGHAGSGKDTIANYITGKYPGYRRLALADAVKHDCISNGMCTQKQSDERTERTRRIWQIWGTEHGRLLDSLYWVYRWCESALRMIQEDPSIEGFVIPDIRFENEAEWVLDRMNGSLILIDTNRESRAPDHSSERRFDFIEMQSEGHERFYTIDNWSTLDRFIVCVAVVVEGVMEGVSE